MGRTIFATALLGFCLSIPAAENSLAGGKAVGNPQAPIRIDLFSDYQCPTCKLLHEQVILPLIADYVKQGKVYLVQREFPMPYHTYAREAACYACAAGAVGRYQEVCDQLFRTQAEWAKDGNVATSACSVLNAASASKVKTLARSPAIAAMVQDDLRLGESEAVNGTPTMIIARIPRPPVKVGPVSYSLLRRYLDSLLN